MTNETIKPWEIFENHKSTLIGSLAKLRDERRLGPGFVNLIVAKLEGNPTLSTPTNSNLNTTYGFNDGHHILTKHVITVEDAQNPHGKTISQVDIYSRDFPAQQSTSLLMWDEEPKISAEVMLYPKHRVELIIKGTSLQLEVVGHIESLGTHNDTDRPSWSLPTAAFSEAQERIIAKARKSMVDPNFGSMRIRCRVANINDPEPDDYLRPEITIKYVRTQHKFGLIGPKIWQEVIVHDDGTEEILSEQPLNRAPRMYIPQFDDLEEMLLDPDSLESITL